MKLKHKLHYVMSGTSMTRITEGRFMNDPRLVNLMTSVFADHFNGKENHSFGSLYNAFTEKGYGERLASVDKYGIPWISDSGGLQLVTTGATVTEEIKDKIYKNQATYSDVAMCFDEMPMVVENMGGITARFDLGNRKFIIDQIDEKAKATGRNVLRQMEVFEQLKSECKIMLILQGNQSSDYQQFLDGILSEIPKDMWNRIAGIAVSTACMGMGGLQSVDMVASYCMLDIPDEIGETLHLLGVGAIPRLLPAVQLMKSGWLDHEVSYDSSTQASRFFVSGKYVGENGKDTPYGRTRNNNSNKIISQIYNKFPQIADILGVDHQEWHDTTGHTFSGSERFNSDDAREVQLNQALVALSAMGSIDNLQSIMDKIIDGTYQYPKKLHPMSYLSEIKSKEDFLSWRRTFKQYLDSNAIMRYNSIQESKTANTLF